MKINFEKLKKKYKVLVMIISYLTTALFMILFLFSNNQIVKYGSIVILCFSFVFSILLTIWYSLYNKKFSTKNKYGDVKDDKIDIIVEYPKVIEEHYLRYVYLERLTLASNLDKIKLGEDDLIYADEVDNKYDKEALTLFYKKYKLGYFYKNGKFRDLLRKYKYDDSFKIITKVCHLNLSKNEIGLKIAFYKKLNTEKFDNKIIELENDIKEKIALNEWLSVIKECDGMGNFVYRLQNIFGQDLLELDSKLFDKFDNFSMNLYAKVIYIGEKIKLHIYALNK